MPNTNHPRKKVRLIVDLPHDTFLALAYLAGAQHVSLTEALRRTILVEEKLQQLGARTLLCEDPNGHRTKLTLHR